MNILIKDTSESTTLTCTVNGCCCAADLIGNACAFDDGQFTHNEETGTYTTDQANLDWWQEVFSNVEESAELEETILAIGGDSARINSIKEEAGQCNDLELIEGCLKNLLTEYKEELLAS